MKILETTSIKTLVFEMNVEQISLLHLLNKQYGVDRAELSEPAKVCFDASFSIIHSTFSKMSEQINRTGSNIFYFRSNCFIEASIYFKVSMSEVDIKNIIEYLCIILKFNRFIGNDSDSGIKSQINNLIKDFSELIK